ncbi:MAG: MFS transporter [Gammaproteobacteria bacterium]|nr:MFS transporter [Gammaproteobacteria bacterium]
MTADQTQPARPFHYGWVIVISSYFVGLLTSGLLAYTRGLFLVPMAREMDSSRLELSLAFTISGVVGAATAPLAGYLFDRYPVPRLMMLMAVWTTLGYGALAAIDGRLGLFLVMGLFFGLATVHLGGVAPAKLVVDWFDTRRGLALSLIAMGASTAGVVTPPMAAALIEWLGWRWTFVIYGAITLGVVLPLIAATLRPAPVRRTSPVRPSDTEDAAGLTAAMPVAERRWRRREYLTSTNFWGIVVIFGVMGCVFSGVTLHLFAHMTDIGVDPLQASLVLSLMAAMALLSKPIFGMLVDRVDPRISVVVSLLAQLAGIGLLLTAAAYPALVLAGLAFGFGYGGMVPLRNALTAIGFGALSFAEITGAARTAMAPLTMGGMPLAGWIHDVYGNYSAAFMTFMILFGAALVAVLLLRLGR